MMKKKINVILLIGVLALWGTVIYKYISHFFQDKQIENNFENNITIKLPDKIEKDTFLLGSLSIDPFLKTVKVIKIENNKPQQTNITTNLLKLKKNEIKPIKPVKVIEENPFPDIKFYGYIKTQGKAEELILIKVNDNLFKTRLNTECNGVVIKKIYRDSLEVKFEKRKRIVVRQ
ncbi:hypothetical protein B0A56_05555 [Flavobacterium columnare NBRC 100251 = ATCC 23463]|uniref:Type II secretion system protein GspC N-terminal domain-containing protein n=2 Tax=Flavobacteriaceae TaxID=49546 RepID=A0AA94EXI5_9FLAO|nr:hypothetical protein [Flavobacterium columnare]MCH4831322.1 hypothetical protein [Flavobacterium columnare]OWP87247.1 hypothetical protein BWK60_04600 [Flavobacterium covae]OXA81797.1 hypothetical protein B0A56_05555 [Flavobacterium columnare NBRC 100251 = ATCC 23463]